MLAASATRPACKISGRIPRRGRVLLLSDNPVTDPADRLDPHHAAGQLRP